MFERDLNLRETSADNEWTPQYIDIIAALYICMLILTAVLIPKLFAVGPFVFSAGILAYPMNTVFGDILTEVYGFNRTRRMIWIGLFCEILLVFLTQIAIALPPPPDFKLQEAYSAIFSNIPRIVVASFTAYVCCEFTNSYIMSRMKLWSNAKNLPLRAVASTIGAQTVDSLVFFTAAFAGVVSNNMLISMILSGIVVKSLYEIIFLPVTMLIVKKLKTLEGIEHFDRYKLDVLKF